MLQLVINPNIPERLTLKSRVPRSITLSAGDPLSTLGTVIDVKQKKLPKPRV